MIVYEYENDGDARTLFLDDDGPKITKSDTGESYACGFVDSVLRHRLITLYNTDFSGKRMLDVGMGNGNILRYVRELLGADVFGFDINDYLYSDNYYKDRTFEKTDIRDIPENLLGTFVF